MNRLARLAGFLAVPLLAAVLAACGSDGGDEASTDSTTSVAAPSTTETTVAEEAPVEPSLDIAGEWAATLEVTESDPPDIIPVEQRTGERSFVITTGACGAGDPSTYTDLEPEGRCVGALTIAGGETTISDLPLYEDASGETWIVEYQRVVDCEDAATGEVIAADAVTATERWTLTPGPVTGGEVTALEGTTDFAQEFAESCPSVPGQTLRSTTRTIAAERS